MRIRTFLPRPEYPRPDRQRGFVHGVDWINLNGPWEFRFDGERRGLEEQWQQPLEGRWGEQINVPFCWESLAAWGEADAAGNDNYFARRVYRNPVEVNRFNYREAARYEVGWYRRTVVIPAGPPWEGRRIILTVGAADFFTDAWCNGRHLGRHEGGFTPFEFDLTESLVEDGSGQRTGTLVIRVEDPMENREQPVGKQWGWYCSASGIWQTVFVEPRPAEHIERFEVRTDLDAAEARLRVFTQGGHELEVEVLSPAGVRATHRFAVEANEAGGAMPIDPVILWDPNDPQLYRLKLTLRGGAQADVVHGYFGMRSLAARPVEEAGAPSALCLNGEPIYLRGALYQSYYPEGIYTAGDVQVLRDDIAYAKRVGFDMLRVHIKVDDPLLLYYADTLGILLMADFPNFGEGGDTPLGRRRYEQTLRAAIARDFNHPSIIAWCLFNETWGFGGQAEFVKLLNPKAEGEVAPPPVAAPGLPPVKLANQEAWGWVEAMWNLAKELDPTRLVEDMSVVAWEHLHYYGHGATDINSWHFYTHDYAHARRHVEEVVKETYAGSTFNYVPGFAQGTQPLINSEYGGVGALDGDRDVSWSFKFLTNELRRHGKISAYIFTELHDVEWERNGFLNYDRTPKDFGYDPTLVNYGDVLPIDAPPVARHGPGAEVELDLLSSHFSRRRHENVSIYWRFSGVDSLGWVHEDLDSGSRAIPFTHHRVELAERVRLRMPGQTMLCTLWVRAMTPDGTLVARNYVQFFVDGGAPRQEELEGKTVLRLEPECWHHAHWSGGCCLRETAAAENCCHGIGTGCFEWRFPMPSGARGKLVRIRVLCEASAHREGSPQTDSFAHPTSFWMLLNGVRIYAVTLPNHPHDARGVLSYLRGRKGAYGYLAHATVEGVFLEQVLGAGDGAFLALQCMVPEEGDYAGGLTVYGSGLGRFPVAPTLILEWGQ